MPYVAEQCYKQVVVTIRLDSNSKIPPFEQLRAQIALQVAAGRLRPGQRLPTIRQLAAQLDLSNGTVARAYRELEYAGILTGEGRRGTFVADSPPIAYSVVERRNRLSEAASVFAEVAVSLGSDDNEALEAIAAALGEARG